MTTTASEITRRHPIVLVTGGTGGHVFPAQALAEELQRLGQTLALFTDQRGKTWSGSLNDVTTHAIPAQRVSGVALGAKIMGFATLAYGALRSRRLLQRLSPSVVVGFGGYPSVATMMAATNLGLPTVIHEQNALLGRANRLLAPRVSAIATSFEEVARLNPRDAPKVIFTGNPVREQIRDLRIRPFREAGKSNPINLLVTGGSQGASAFSTVIPQTMAALPNDLRDRIHLTQQCRPEDMEMVRAAYDKIGLKVELAPFFDDLAERLGNAHLVICRSGASTIAELTTAGRPAILVPYPHAADDHQTANAQAMVDQGGAEMIHEPDFTPTTLAARLKLIFSQPRAIETMATAARAAGQKDAARNMAALVMGMVPTSNCGEPGRKAA